jgi:hypothetical protein
MNLINVRKPKEATVPTNSIGPGSTEKQINYTTVSMCFKSISYLYNITPSLRDK